MLGQRALIQSLAQEQGELRAMISQLHQDMKQPAQIRDQVSDSCLPRHFAKTNANANQNSKTVNSHSHRSHSQQKHFTHLTNTSFELFSKQTLCIHSYRNENHYQVTFSKYFQKTTHHKHIQTKVSDLASN